MKRAKEDRLGMQRIDVHCARHAGLTIEILFQGKWKAQILCAMRSGPIRLGHLARIVPGASKKMLTQNLRKLEADGIVVRKDLTDLVLHMCLASWFGPFRQFVLAHPWDIEGLGNIHPVVVAAVGMWESLLSDFQGLWEGWENSSIVFPCFP